MYNPGYTGVNYKHYGAINFRNQWVGINGNPITLTGNYEAKLKTLGGLGIGYMNDRLGSIENNKIYLNYAYHLKLGVGTLGFGISGVYNRSTIDDTKIIYANDASSFIDNQSESQGKFNTNIGVFFKTDLVEVGISTTQLNEPVYDKLNIENVRHYYVMGAYKFKLSELIELKTSTLLKTDPIAPLSVEVNNLVTYKKMYWSGITFRKSESIGIQAGTNILEKYRIGYSYERVINNLAKFTSGSHEFVMALMIK